MNEHDTGGHQGLASGRCERCHARREDVEDNIVPTCPGSFEGMRRMKKEALEKIKKRGARVCPED